MSDMYCCYCLMPQGEKVHCCQENHFVELEELPQEDQEAIRGELDDER